MIPKVGLCAYCAAATSQRQVLGDQSDLNLLDLFLHSIMQQLFSASLPYIPGIELWLRTQR